MKIQAVALSLALFSNPALAGSTVMKNAEGQEVALWCNSDGCFVQSFIVTQRFLDTLGVSVLNSKLVSQHLFEGEVFTAPTQLKTGKKTRLGEGGAKNFRTHYKTLKMSGYVVTY